MTAEHPPIAVAHRPARLAGSMLPWMWLPLLAAWTLSAAELHQRQVPRNPSSAKECAICHYRWVDTFFMDGRGTDLAPLQTEQVEGTSEMCFSCHDGSVLDSRWAFEKGRGHESGATPPPGMRPPATFPLDPQGKMQCVTCHSAHGVSSVTGEMTSTFLRVFNTNSSICLLCHPTMAGDLAGANHPLGPVTNAIPRQLWSKHSTPETAAHNISCETCHTAHAGHEEHLLKQSVSDSALCLTCHTDKNPLNADGTRNFSHAINMLPTNAIVPATLLTNGAQLAINGTLTCLTCHKVHQNKIEKHLLVAKLDNQSSFCFNCHADKRGLVQNQHNLAAKFPAEKNVAGQTVAQGGPCSACHLPHKNARALAGAGDPNAALCLSCHGASGLASRTNLLGRGHPTGIPLPVVQSFPAAARPLSLPLFDSGRRPAANGNITCITCHDPHGSPAQGPLRRSGNFLRASPSALCQECHANQASVAGTRHDLSGAAPAVLNIQGKAPTDTGSCGACHLVHSAGNSTWARPWVASPNPSEKCLSCHRPGGPAEKKVAGPHSHPLDVSPLPSVAAAAALPLWANSPQAGATNQMSCLTCHNPHRWNPTATGPGDKLVEGGPRDSFLRQPAAPAPTLCATCHPGETVVIGTKHDLSIKFPDNANIRGQRAADSGPCLACHLAHNSPTASKIWARDLKRPAVGLWMAPSQAPSHRAPLVDQMCISCHSENAVGASKVPTFTYHPPTTVVNTPASRGTNQTFFPLFDPVSGKLVNEGTISCSSCHNVHQWSAKNPGPGQGLNQEGDSNNSFLRHRSMELPCKYCHGADSIYRYQYFHKATTHRGQDDLGEDGLTP